MADTPTKTLKRQEVFEIYGGLAAGLMAEELTPQLRHALVRNRHLLKAIGAEIEDCIKDAEQQKRKLLVKYCDKGPDGKPLVEKKTVDGKEVTRYVGLIYGLCPEYDTAVEAIDTQVKAYLAEVVEVKYFEIKDEHLSGKVPGLVEAAIFPLTESGKG